MLRLADLLRGVMVIDPTAPAIEFERKWYRWGDLADTVEAVRGALAALGAPGDLRVGILMRNRPGPLAATIATIVDGQCVVSLNPFYPDDKLCTDLVDLALPVVIAEAADLERPAVRDALEACGSAVIEVSATLEGAQLRKSGGPLTDRSCSPDVIFEMLTSGTTGPPKRVALQRQAFEKSFVGAMGYERSRRPGDPAILRAGTTSILANPISHIGGLWGALSSIAAGRRACLIERFTVSAWRDAVIRHRPKVAAAVPASLRMILDAEIPREDLSSLVAIRTGTAPLDPAIIEKFWDRYQIPVLQNYGATEFSGSVAGWTLRDFRAHHQDKYGSVGRFQAGVSGRIVDPQTGAILAPGEPGILEMKAAQFGKGNEWQRTSDRAVIDEDGFLFILGRADNAIIRGGFKVHPDEIVAVIEKHPAIREAVVVGFPDYRLGEVPVAAVMLKTGKARPDETEFASFLRLHLLPYQVPTQFLFVTDVPRTPSMKPALPQVRALFDHAALQGAA